MSAYSDLILGLSPSAYYRLGESTGTTLNATVGINGTYAASGVTYGVAGGVINDADTAVTFDGTSDAATVNDDNSLDLGDTAFSISLLFKRSATVGTNQALLRKVGHFELRLNSSNQIELRQEGNVVANSTSSYTDQNWHSLLITRGGGTAKIFVDGVNFTNFVTNFTFSDSTLVFRLGHAGANVRRYIGSLDEVALFKTELSDADALALHRTARGTVLSSPAMAANLAAPAPSFRPQIAVPAMGVSVEAEAPTIKPSVAVPAAGIEVEAPAPTVRPSVEVPSAGIEVEALNPTVRVRIAPPAISILLDAEAPTIKTSVAVPATAVEVSMPNPRLAGAQVSVPAAEIEVAAHAPTVKPKVASPALSVTLEALDPSIVAARGVEVPTAGITVSMPTPEVPQIIGDVGGNAGVRVERRIPPSKIEAAVMGISLEALPPGINSPDEIDELSLIMLLYG